ncbi:hypothetical protein CTEN210_16591 [Chaetoceros tenuissimus]|uniref:RPAP1 N-terminal domain-containing protein n=1 Tax=Chaetoceros tenuissimus TaxID=426638 RepID=A0AAD3DBV8_9STRA|nr:hypothetical protein CTEN210_16591 [Chaetoceros tenuissimus]
MANTEGIPDEDLKKLLSIDKNDFENRRGVPRGIIERQRMMDDFDIDPEFKPAATVIRSSRRPVVKSSREVAKQKRSGISGKVSEELDRKEKSVTFQDDSEDEDELPPLSGDDEDELPPLSEEGEETTTKDVMSSSSEVPNIQEKDISNSSAKAAIISEYVMERKNPKEPTKKISKFKLRQMQKNESTKSGFPSFDIPVGKLTRGGGKAKPKFNTPTSSLPEQTVKKEKVIASVKNDQSDADKMIANMSKEEINESISEIESILSPDMINFLKSRKKTTKISPNPKGVEKKSIIDQKSEAQEKKDVQISKPSIDNRATTSELLSNIRTEEDLEKAFVETFNSTLVTEDNEENERTLEKATELLRSTSTRQRLMGAKIACELLEERLTNQQSNESVEKSSDYPDLLPVALRCILDAPSPFKQQQIISSSLKALSILVRLFVHTEHRLNVGCKIDRNTENDIYQQYFMNDDVAITASSKLYQSDSKAPASVIPAADGCYTTDASAESAKADAAAFYSDPAWTLLSRMRIIPCLSNILLSYQKVRVKSSVDFSIESSTIESICSILCTLSLRSPGAAVAIAQNKHLFPVLINMTLDPNNDESQSFVVNTSLAFPTIYLSSVIARQSREASKAIEEKVLESILYITASKALNDEEHVLQQWCLILWRTMLRYGLGLNILSSILSMSVERLTESSYSTHNIAAEYFSAYSVICDCAKFASLHKGFKNADNKNLLTDDGRETLAMSGMWLSSHVENVANLLSRHSIDLDTDEGLKLAASKLRFLTSYFEAATPSDIMGNISAPKNVIHVPVLSFEKIIPVIEIILQPGDFWNCLQVVISPWEESVNSKKYAAAHSFINAFFRLIVIAQSKMQKSLESREEGKMSENNQAQLLDIMERLFIGTTQALTAPGKQLSKYKDVSLATKRYSNICRSTISCFLLDAIPLVQSKVPMSSIQSYVFSLIGSFERGEEALAVQILSYNVLFSEVAKERELFGVLALRDIMLKEFCIGSVSQAQLDHSFKLSGSAGLLPSGIGPFGLESLRSETDKRAPPNESSGTDSTDLEPSILPVGQDWIWKLLSSSSSAKDSESDSAQQATEDIINAALRIIIHIENTKMPYADFIGKGSKMYFLLNSCFAPENVLRSQNFVNLFLETFSKYDTISAGDTKSFLTSCYIHSSHHRKSMMDGADYDKVLEVFFNDIVGPNDMDMLSRKSVQAIDDFVNDLSTGFIDFGAQYTSFIYGIRFLLMPTFPIRVKKLLLEKIKDLLHLLTTQEELDDPAKLQLSLSKFLLGGNRLFDDSERDNPAWLDLLASTLSKMDTIIQRREGFFYVYAISSLARNLASSSVKCECGLKAMKKRLRNMPKPIYADISACAKLCMEQKCSNANELAAIAIKTCNSDPENLNDFDTVVEKLVNTYNSISNDL